MRKPPLDFANLLQVPYIDVDSGFQISSTGKFLAYSANPTGQWLIYLIDLNDPLSSPHPISTSLGGKFNPRFSPDCRRLLYLADFDGSEAFDIFCFDTQTGENINLTADTPETILAMDWSPDGQRFAFISDRAGKLEVYIRGLEDSASELIFSPPYPAISVEWSPDGCWLAVVAESTASDYATFLVSATGINSHQLSYNNMPIDAHRIAFSDDGRRLAFCSDYSGSHQIGSYDLDSGEVAWLTNGVGEKSDPTWSPDGSKLVFLVSDGPTTHLAILNTDAAQQTARLVAPARGVCSHPIWTPDGSSIIFGFETPGLPPDLWRFNLSDQTFHQLTQSLPPGYSPSDFVQPEHITYLGMDGRTVPALLFLPTGSELPAPAVLVPHGGPNWLFQFIWYPIFQHMVSRGWVVLAPNYRGSTGYGRQWQLASRYDMGGEDTRDVVAGAQYLLRSRLAQPNRIGITGRSYGGFLTMTCLTQYPELWACGSAVVPFLNWFASNQACRSDLAHWDIENMGDPVENYQRWYDHSPFFFLERIRVPVQMISGANDPRCPASESIAARDALVSLGKSVELLLYPDEGHAFLNRENVIDHELKRMNFLARHLDG